MDSALISVWDGLAALIDGAGAAPLDSQGKTLLPGRRVFRGRVTPNTNPPVGYFLFASPGEGENDLYQGSGLSGVYRIHCWSDSPDNAIKLYRWLKQHAHEARPSIQGHVLWQGLEFRFIDLRPDAEGVNWQAICEIAVETLEAA